MIEFRDIHKSFGPKVVLAEAEVPLAAMFGYATDIRSVTQGKAEFTMEFHRYAPVPRPVQDQLVEEHRKAREAERKK